MARRDYEEPTPEEDDEQALKAAAQRALSDDGLDEANAVALAEDAKQEEAEAEADVPGTSSVYYEETVTMSHPALENSTTTTTKLAYDEVWAEKGWVLAEAEDTSSDDQGDGPEAAV